MYTEKYLILRSACIDFPTMIVVEPKNTFNQCRKDIRKLLKKKLIIVFQIAIHYAHMPRVEYYNIAVMCHNMW